MYCPICKSEEIVYCPHCHYYTCRNRKCPKYPYSFSFKEGVMQKISVKEN